MAAPVAFAQLCPGPWDSVLVLPEPKGSAQNEFEGLIGMGCEMADGAGNGLAGLSDYTQQADDGVAQTGEHLRAMALADLAAVLIESDIAHPVEAVFDAPMVSIEGQQPVCPGLLWSEVGETEDLLGAYLAGLEPGHLPLDAADLADVGKVEVVVERRVGPDGALLDPAMSLVEGRVLRGKAPPRRRRAAPRPGFSGSL